MSIHIKTVIRCKFADGRGRTAAILIDHLFIFFLLHRCILIFFTIQNGTKNNSCFGECIIWQQSFIRKEIKNILFSKFLKNRKKCRLLAFQLLDFFIIGTVLRLIFQFFYHRLQRIYAGLQRILLFSKALKSIQNFDIHGAFIRAISSCKCVQLFFRAIIQICSKHLHKRVKLPGQCALHIIQEIKRKHIVRSGVQFL